MLQDAKDSGPRRRRGCESPADRPPGDMGAELWRTPPGDRESSAHEDRHGRSGTHADGRGLHQPVWDLREPSGNGRKATGRGDTDRLLTRGKLRRVVHRVEGDQKTGGTADSSAVKLELARAKLDEPHDR